MKKANQTVVTTSLAAILLFAQSLAAQIVTTNCTPAPGGILSWWPADGYALDVVGTNNATLEDGAGYTEGEVGQAFSFNGSNAYVSLPTNFFPFPVLGSTVNEPFSFELWFRTTSGGVIFGQQSGPVGSSISAWVPGLYVGTDGKLRAEMLWSGSVSPMTGSNIVNDGVFHHTAVTYDGTNVIFYLDGKSLQTNKQSQQADAAIYYYQFGTGYTKNGWPGANGGWYYFNGLIDEPALYSRVLEPSEIEAIYAAGAAGKCFSNAAPVIIQQPVGVTTPQNDSATFTVAATGTAPLTYQWQFNGTNVANATDSTLSLTNVQPSSAGYYSVIVTNIAGSTNSTNAILIVNVPPSPSADTIAYYRFENGTNGDSAVGTNTILDSSGNALNGTPFGMLVYSSNVPANPVPLTGATNLLSLTFDGSSGRIFIPDYPLLALTNSLTIEAFIKAAAPGGGTFAQSQIVFRGDDRGGWDPYFLCLSGTDLLFAITDASDVISSVQAPLSLNVWHHVAGTLDNTTGVQSLYIDGLLVAHTTTAERPFGPLTGPNPGLGIGNVESSVDNPQDIQYFDGLIDEVRISDVALTPDQFLNARQPPTITQQPASTTTNQGAEISFTVGATGTAPLFYQWQFDGTNLPEATDATLTLTNVQRSEAGSYSVVITNMVGSTNSLNAALNVNTITYADWTSASSSGENATAFGTLSLSSGTVSVTYSGEFAFVQANDAGNQFWTQPNSSSLPYTGNSIVGNTPTNTDIIALSETFGVEVDTVTFSESVHNPIMLINSLGSIQPQLVSVSYVFGQPFTLLSAGQGYFGGNSTTLVQSGNTLTGTEGSGAIEFLGDVTTISWTTGGGYGSEYWNGFTIGAETAQPIGPVASPPGISIATPVNGGTFNLGDPIAITADVTNGTGVVTNVVFFDQAVVLTSISQRPFSFLWTNAPAGTNVLTAVAYTSDDLSDTSLPVNITVTIPTPTPPVFTQQPTSIITNAGANVAFTVSATGSPPLSYQWFFDQTNLLLNATNSTLTLTNVQTNQDGIYYSVVVSNVARAVASSNALLTVYGPPVIVQQPLNVTTNPGATVEFTVIATNLLPIGYEVPMSYQWESNGLSVLGATNSTLTLRDVQTNARYLVIVSNPAGPTPSSNATLTVLYPPQVSIVNPTPGSMFNTGTPITITASVIPGSGLVTNVDFYNGVTLLGQVGQSPYTFVWTNAPQGTPSLTAVALANDRLSATSSPVSISIIVSSSKPAITLVSPANQSTFCPGAPIPLVATVTGGSSAPTNVSFYADSTALLGSVPTASDSAQWTNAAEGSYSVTAVATFPDGSTLTSPAAEVTISSQCGQVAIVSGAVTSEISLMENGLSNRMGLTYAVFTPAEATVGVLTPYKLVIWDDLDGGTNQITGSTVGVLANVFGAGIPLYLIGPHLAQDALALSLTEQSQWIGLTGLTPATGVGGDGGVEFTNSSQSDPIVDGSFGTAANFAAAADFDLTTVTNSSATVVAQSGAVPVMVAYPGFGVASGQARRVTQNFEVGGGSDTNSLAQRQTLFLNAVCWLTDCSICTLVGVAPKADVTPNPAIVGAPVTLNWTVANDGDCAGTGVVLSCPLPAGAQFVGAAADSGGSQYDSLQNQVVFELGQLPRGSVSVSYTLIFQQGGVFTNTMNVSVIGIPPVQAQTTVQVNGLNLLPTGASGYQMQFTGNASQTYQIQTSTDLINWLNWSNIVGPNWQITLPAPSPSGTPRQFYRAVGQ